MMKNFVKQELDDQIKTNYPHMRYPPCIYARVKILDKNKQTDTRFPEVPMVSTKVPVESGDIVVVILLYGECDPYIVGRCD